jgi:hypothetical protein
MRYELSTILKAFMADAQNKLDPVSSEQTVEV